MHALVLNIISQCAHYLTKEQFINHRLASFSACTVSISIWVSISERPILADNSNSPVCECRCESEDAQTELCACKWLSNAKHSTF